MMKKIFIMLAVCLSSVACTLSKGESNGRTQSNMAYFSKLFFSIVESDVAVIDYCLLIDDYLDADDEERKSKKYTGIAYYSKDNLFVINGFGEIKTSGKSFFDPEMKWTANVFNSAYETRRVTCSGDNIWEVKPGSEADQVTYDVRDRVRYVGLDEENRIVWECESSGEYKESAECKAEFYSEGAITFVKYGRTSSSSATGQFIVDFYRNGLPVDWYKTYYNNGSKIKEVYSLCY